MQCCIMVVGVMMIRKRKRERERKSKRRIRIISIQKTALLVHMN